MIESFIFNPLAQEICADFQSRYSAKSTIELPLELVTIKGDWHTSKLTISGDVLVLYIQTPFERRTLYYMGDGFDFDTDVIHRDSTLEILGLLQKELIRSCSDEYFVEISPWKLKTSIKTFI